MAMKFVAPDIALAFHHLFIGKPPGEKGLFSRRKTGISLCLQKKNRSPVRSNGSRSGACALIFPLCHCRMPELSHAHSFRYYMTQINGELRHHLCISPFISSFVSSN